MDEYRAAWGRLPEGPKPERAPEYTPSDDTTQDIRADFAGFPHRCNDCHHMENAARFDRWLAEHDRVVAANAWEEADAAILAHIGRQGTSAAGWPTNPYRITEED